MRGITRMRDRGAQRLQRLSHRAWQETSKQEWVEDITRMRDRAIFDPTAVPEATWDFMEIVLQGAEQCPLALELWLTATARGRMSSG